MYPVTPHACSLVQIVVVVVVVVFVVVSTFVILIQ